MKNSPSMAALCEGAAAWVSTVHKAVCDAAPPNSDMPTNPAPVLAAMDSWDHEAAIVAAHAATTDSEAHRTIDVLADALTAFKQAAFIGAPKALTPASSRALSAINTAKRYAGALSHSTGIAERSPAMSKTELARRITNGMANRARDVDWKLYDIKRVGKGKNLWTVSLAKMDAGMRARVMKPGKVKE